MSGKSEQYRALHAAEAAVAEAEGRLLAAERTIRRCVDQLAQARCWAEHARDQIKAMKERADCECGTRLAFVSKHSTSPLYVCPKHAKRKS